MCTLDIVDKKMYIYKSTNNLVVFNHIFSTVIAVIVNNFLLKTDERGKKHVCPRLDQNIFVL